MKVSESGAYDLETITLLRTILDAVCAGRATISHNEVQHGGVHAAARRLKASAIRFASAAALSGTWLPLGS
jgi:hypothetical protein